MSKRAEELAADIVKIADQVPYRSERLILTQRIQSWLEQYGQEVREAAAKHFETYGFHGDHTEIAETLREMPLP